jgi:hypothetical protein
MMAKPTLVVAFLLVAVGVAGYLVGHPDPATGHVSYTALIPAWMGLALGILGAVSFNDHARKHAMHAAAIVGLLAIIGDGMQLLKTFNNTETAPDVRNLKLASMGATLVICVIFLALCIRSFVLARKNRLAGK